VVDGLTIVPGMHPTDTCLQIFTTRKLAVCLNCSPELLDVRVESMYHLAVNKSTYKVLKFLF